MIDSSILAFAGIALVLAITPGADTMLVMRSVLSGGRPAGVLTTFGVCLGLLVHAAFSALGISIILMRSATAFEVVKWVGGGYLIYLGLQSIVKSLRGAPVLVPNPGKPEPTPRSEHPHRQFLMQGLLTNVLNPKVALFYLAFLPQFIRPEDGVFLKSVLLGGIHLFFSLAWLLVVATLVNQLRRLLTQNRTARILEGVTGTLLLGLGGRLALQRS